MVARYVHLLDLVSDHHDEPRDRVPYDRDRGVRNPLRRTRPERFLGADRDQFLRHMPEMPVAPTGVPDGGHGIAILGDSRAQRHSHAVRVNTKEAHAIARKNTARKN
jgi:hypothetical protein